MGEVDELTLRITAALEAKPVVDVPEDFAARVMSRLPARPAMRQRLPRMAVRSHYGTWMLRAAVAVLLVAMLALAAVTGSSITSAALEGACFLEFLGLALWMALARRRI